MIASELLAQKIQEIMGSTYKVLPFHLFSLKYTTPRETPQGLIYDVNYQAFEEFKNIVLAPVTAAEITPVSLPYIASAYNYEIKFSIPADLLKVDESNTLLETPKINFFADYKIMKTALNNKEVYFYDGVLPELSFANLAVFPATGSASNVYKAIDTGYYYLWVTSAYVRTGYKANLTISDPNYLGKEETSNGGRIVYSVKGIFQISDWDVGTGADTKISFYIKNSGGTYAEHFFENITNLNIDANSQGVDTQNSDKLGTEADAAVKSHQLSFQVGDRIPLNNAAHQLLENKIYTNLETLSANETDEYKKRKVRVRLYKKTTLNLDFWAVLSVTYNATGATSYGVYTVTLLNDEKGV